MYMYIYSKAHVELACIKYEYIIHARELRGEHSTIYSSVLKHLYSMSHCQIHMYMYMYIRRYLVLFQN